MAMGIVSDEDLEKELSNCSTGKVVPINRPGRNEGDKNVPESLRKIIGETNELDSRTEALEIAKSFGISSSSVSAYANGSHSTNSYNKPTEIKDHIQKSKERISSRARSVLLKSLQQITENKLSEAKVTECASIAKDMSGILKNIDPPTVAQPLTGPQFIIYAPQFTKEEHFETIQVNE